MAEKDKSPSSIDDIEEQIRKLEKEKEELERINERRHLEQRLQFLQDNVTVLKSGAGPSSKDNQTSGKSTSSRGRGSGDLNASLEDSRARLRSLQQSILNTPVGGTSSVGDDFQDDQHRSSDDADEVDDVMSTKHKQALRINRDVLVENMTPDDIFNDLISKHVLTNSDVSRIKEKNTTEAINEELLNVLIRRSDKAFHVFVSSLRRTLQGWLANRLDPGSQPSNKRKRRTGELNLNLDCERVVPARNKSATCSCQEVEEQILQMAKGAFAHIRRRDASPAAFEQFRKEVQQTNIFIKESMEIRNILKELCRHGDIVDLSEGSVCFTMRCASLATCKELWNLYISGHLLSIFQDNLVSPLLLEICGAREICLCLRISRLEYLTCALELAYKEQKRLLHHKSFIKVTPIKRRLRKSKNLPNGNAYKGRQAFKEICLNESLAKPRPTDNTVSSTCTSVSCHDLENNRILSSSSICEDSANSFSLHPMMATMQKSATKLKTYEHRNLTKFPVLKNRVTENKILQKSKAKPFALSPRLCKDSGLNLHRCCPYNLRYRILDS